MPTTEAVKRIFERPHQYYLDRRRYDITLRAEVVKHFTEKLHYRKVLDIGCGDGSISLPLLNRDNRITLVDLSEAMTTIAAGRIPTELAGNVDVRNEDFIKGSFDPEGYDLIICVGLLAHVERPRDLIGKIAAHLRPGGHLVLEFTDSRHFVGAATRMLHKVIWPVLRRTRRIQAAGASHYEGNILSFREVSRIVTENRLMVVSIYRHAVFGLPGVHRVLSQRTMYNAVRLLFGTAQRNRNAWLGNEYICLIARDGDVPAI